MKDVTFDLHPCARSKGRTAPAAPRGHTMKEHSLYFSFFPVNVYDKQHTMMTSVIAGSFESEYFLVSPLI